MLVDVILPKIGMAMQDAMIVAWLKTEGDAVIKGEPLLEMETEKVVECLEAPASGTLVEILIQPNEYADVGAVLARIRASENNP